MSSYIDNLIVKQNSLQMPQITLKFDSQDRLIRFLSFLRQTEYKEAVEDEVSILPVVWASVPDISALFSAAKENPLNLTEVRKTWKRKG